MITQMLYLSKKIFPELKREVPYLKLVGNAEGVGYNRKMISLDHIQFKNTNDGLRGYNVGNFFAEWPEKPNKEVLLKTIEGSDYVVLAIDTDTHSIIGYITAISDGVMSAYIPFLEVDAAYQKMGIGHKLVNLILEQLDHLYMIDLICDKNLAGFYKEAGMESWHGMIKRKALDQHS